MVVLIFTKMRNRMFPILIAPFSMAVIPDMSAFAD